MYMDGPYKLDVSSLHVGILHASNIQRKQGHGPAATTLDLKPSIKLMCNLGRGGPPYAHWPLLVHTRAGDGISSKAISYFGLARVRSSTTPAFVRPSINRPLRFRVYSDFCSRPIEYDACVRPAVNKYTFTF